MWLLKVGAVYALVDAFMASDGLKERAGDLQKLDFLLIGCELFRRWMWVFFRLEREWALL
jgi:EXS family